MKSQSILKKTLVLGVFIVSTLFLHAQEKPLSYKAPTTPDKYKVKTVPVPLDTDIVLPLVVATGAISLILKLKKKKKV